MGDMELTAGGILATCAAGGGHIATLALTAGEKGVPAGQTVEQYREQKLREAEAFAGMLGGTSYVLDYPDGFLPDNEEVRLAVCDLIRKEKPDLIVTHHEKSMHKDHAACHRIVKDAWFYAALPAVRRELGGRGGLQALRIPGGVGGGVRPLAEGGPDPLVRDRLRQLPLF